MNRPRSSSIGTFSASKSIIDFRNVGQVSTFATILEESATAAGVSIHSENDKSIQNTVDIEDLKSDDDLEMLKKRDPFLYYSIPAVRRAEFLNEVVGVTKILRSEMPRHQSCPGRMMADDQPPGPRTILRRSRISFECHDSLTMKNIDGLGDSFEKDDGDPILHIFDLCNE
mmetsp:Transcript_10897/g.23069  ORF Transcript_10897/g.23069 Transcript_10897/m.23069 type:complete len:171 (-) Transcript_10897:307-819(-)|eukprot:CAMPEP_0171350340 /NCGR_PEP_ID=MMETSP0878-20121228/36164_1 /TAXON_ID=67004 /ORGANISM="Thalassiosira weissflogii, Strain CCMP1336" /LENGTH=170 /DNA_ID=CAMNT_0011855245 /DNA_START=158 /DNA_END=670 /DNA_ORIENTATION=-